MICKWFFKKQEVEDFYVTSFEEQIRDLRRRIEEQKQAIGYYKPRPHIEHETREVLEEAPRVAEKQEQRNKELDDIKAKLMRRK
jgi:hypothetical protein